jgi:hypothetical protein
MRINQLIIRTSYIFIFLLAQLLFSNSSYASYAIYVNVVGGYKQSYTGNQWW